MFFYKCEIPAIYAVLRVFLDINYVFFSTPGGMFSCFLRTEIFFKRPNSNIFTQKPAARLKRTAGFGLLKDFTEVNLQWAIPRLYRQPSEE